MASNTKFLFNWINWLTNKYVELERKTLPFPCKLQNIIKKEKKKFAQIQIAGQVHFLEVEVTSLIQKNLFEFFSPQDKKILFESVYHKENFYLSDYFYSSELEKEMVVLTEKLSGRKLTITVECASINNELIEQISSSDANKIGYLAGLETAKKNF